MKKLVALVTILVLFLGGCSTMNQKETLTREQQNNIITRIVRGYEIQEIEIINFTKNESTGTYLLSIKINNDTFMETTILLENIASVDKIQGVIGLSPVEKFKSIERPTELDDNESINLDTIKIKYLEE